MNWILIWGISRDFRRRVGVETKKRQQTWRVKTLKHGDRKWQIHVEPMFPD
jgi:hypothetical protein